jgi:hypothetical protein
MGPLDDAAIERIQAFLDDPSEETWNGCYSLCVGGMTTVWKAVCRVDPGFPRSKSIGPEPSGYGWPRVPDPFTVRRALKACQTQAA